MKILIMESNESAADVLRFLLRDVFDVIKIAEDKTGAIQELRGGKFDIFLIRFDGDSDQGGVIEFLRYIHVEKFNPYMKIIVMSDGKNKNIWPVFLGAGVDTIVKRFPSSNVVEAVKNIAITIEIST